MASILYVAQLIIVSSTVLKHNGLDPIPDISELSPMNNTAILRTSHVQYSAAIPIDILVRTLVANTFIIKKSVFFRWFET